MNFTPYLVLLCAIASPLHATIINFDDRPGRPPPSSPGSPVAPEYIIDDEYLPLGVRFNSGGGGIFISTPSNPLSWPNVAGATGPGPVISYTHPVEASFWVSGQQGWVDSVALTLTSTSSTSTLRAFDTTGALLGSTSGGAAATLSLSFPGQIHSITLSQGPMAFDDFTFQGLAPAPGALPALIIAATMRRRRRS